jgi:hypothetical protein
LLCFSAGKDLVWLRVVITDFVAEVVISGDELLAVAIEVVVMATSGCLTA